MRSLSNGDKSSLNGDPGAPSDPTPEPNAMNDSSSGNAEADNQSRIDIEELLNNSDTPMLLTPVLFKEAALDSPTFRSSMNHLNIQFENIDRWFDSFIRATQKLSQEMEVLQDLANAVTSQFVPSFVTQGVIDHDYSMLAMRRYAESSRHFWTNVIKKVRGHQASIIEPLVQFQKTELKKYKDCRRTFESSQSRFDTQLSRYLSLSKNKEPSALREDAFQLAEARTVYIRASFDLAYSMPVIQAKLDIVLVKTLSQPWILTPKEFASADPVAQRIGVEMIRLKSWAKTMHKSYKPLSKELERAGREMEEATVERFTPSSDLNHYTVQNSTISQFVPIPSEQNGKLNEKHGWLFVKSTVSKGVRQVWVRRWVFVKNGMFGWLNISPSKTFVQESDKIGVLLCHVTPVSTEDRRFCFEIKTKDSVIFLQAETLNVMKSWLQVFEDAKYLAIESDKKSAIPYAFQRVPPLINEFASTAGTSVDAEMTTDPGNSADNSASANPDTECITLMNNSCAANIQALMTAGESLANPSARDAILKVSFSSIGPFGAALAPSPLLNVAMPTSMSQEAILSNSILTSTAIPAAVTANYWGSVNWVIYRADSTSQVQSEPKAMPEVSQSLATSILPICSQLYPSYYPLELRSQDAQLRAIFQTLIGESLNDRVLLVFRCVGRPNPDQQIPTRIYMTLSHVYIYSHFLGMSAAKIIPIQDMISTECRTNINQDILYILGREWTANCSLYLDSCRTLQKRVQLLIDNAHSTQPLNLEQMLVKLQAFGANQKDEQLMFDEKKLGVWHPMASVNNPLSDPSIPSEDLDLSEEKFLHSYMNSYIGGNLASIFQPELAIKPKLDTAANLAVEDGPLSDMSKLMSQLSSETEFDIPAKALFHIMFGEKSPVFTYTDSGTLKRDSVSLAPWKLMTSNRMEREIHFNIVRSELVLENENENVMFIQRLEKLYDNTCYIVYERRAMWKFPEGGSFYTAYRYVILRQTRSTCRLSIWSSVEWLKSTGLKNITEPMIQKVLNKEAKVIAHRALQCRHQLGSKGGTTTAIRLFGKLGATVTPDSNGIPITDSKLLTSSSSLPVIKISSRTIIRDLMESAASTFISFLGGVCLVVTRVSKGIWNGIFTHKVLILALILSCLFNLYLVGRSTQGYWMERHAQKYANQFGLLPGSHTVMKRSILLEDVEKLIRNGSEFSVEKSMEERIGQNTSNSLCYNKFQSLALLPDNDEVYSPENFNLNKDDRLGILKRLTASQIWSSSQTPYALRNRIYNLRSKLGIQRNSLMVELRMVNRIESDLILAEWRTWLYDEVSVCSRILQDFAIMQLEMKSYNGENDSVNNNDCSANTVVGVIQNGKKPQTSSSSSSDSAMENDSQHARFLKMMSTSSLEIRQYVSKYCMSCSRELQSLVSNLE